MKRIIHTIRLQPPEFRMIVSVGLALFFTAIIGFFWAISLSTASIQEEKSDAPGPLSVIINSAKSIFSGSYDQQQPVSTENVIQVIDAGQVDAQTP